MHSPTPKKEPAVPSAPSPQRPAPGPGGGVVHESASQRQHVRIRVPGSVDIGGRRCKLVDLSAGGICFETGGAAARIGEGHRGTLTLTVDGVALSLTIAFQIRNTAEGRAGACFQDLGPQEISVLRHIISAHLSGELVNVGEVLHTMGRDNFTKARNLPAAARAAPPTGGSRARAVLGTAAFLAAAVVALGYTVSKVNRTVFASTATAAKVAGPVYTVAMPREGTFYSLVPEDGIVKKGAPIGSFEAPVLDLVRNQALGANMSPEQLQRLLKVTVKGTITSPCDCKVQTQFAADGQYVVRDQALFELAPRDFQPYLVARFRNDQMEDLATGDRVSFRVSGDMQSRVGRISQVRAHGEGDTVDGDVMVMIQPEEPLPAELLARPAEVVAGGLPPISFGSSGTATARERTTP